MTLLRSCKPSLERDSLQIDAPQHGIVKDGVRAHKVQAPTVTKAEISF